MCGEKGNEHCTVALLLPAAKHRVHNQWSTSKLCRLGFFYHRRQRAEEAEEAEGRDRLRYYVLVTDRCEGRAVP